MLGMFSYSKAAVERAMKVQEVMLRTWAKKITWWQAAEIPGISDRHLPGIREATRSSGISVCWIAGGTSPRPSGVLARYREQYFDSFRCRKRPGLPARAKRRGPRSFLLMN
jgi:hypothetical protein